MASLSADKVIKPAVDDWAWEVAGDIRDAMVTGISTQRFGLKELKESTKRRKGSSTPLIDTAALWGSLTRAREPEGAFAGVLRQATNKKGDSLANIAEVHVKGKTIRAKSKSGKSYTVRIPRRDFVTPAVKEVMPGAESKLVTVVRSAMSVK
jgi:hypothetical protein